VKLDADPFLGRLERDAVAVCAVTAAGGALVAADGWMAAAVASGGLLAAVSYRAIKGAVDAVLRGSGGAWALVKFFTRYGILGLAAYVMLVRFRLHPVGVLVGASSLVVAAALAAARFARSPGRPGSR